jgi:hypothetical protein
MKPHALSSSPAYYSSAASLYDTQPSPSPRGSKSGEYIAVREVEVPPADSCPPLAWLVDPSTVCDTIHLIGDTGEGVVHIVDGDLGWVSSSLPLTTFLHRIVEAGHVSHAEVEVVNTLCRIDEGTNVCEALVKLGLLPPNTLREMVVLHMREHLCALLALPNVRATWTQSHLSFEEQQRVSMSEALEPAERRKWRDLMIDAGGSPSSAHDDGRIPLRRTAQVETIHGPLVMTTVDFSLAGARLRSAAMLPIASRVVVHLNIAGEELELPGRVVRFDRATDKELPAIVVLWTHLSEAAEKALSRVWSGL